MSETVLYDYWRSSASYRVRIALGLAGEPFRSVPVNLLQKEHKSAEHLARHPQGLVPVLEIDGKRFTQSLAIIEYLAETRPESRLMPQDAAERARVRALSHLIAMEIHPVCNLGVVAHVLDLAKGGDDMRLAWMQRFIGQGLAAFETMLEDKGTGRYCHANSPTMADGCLVPQLYNARRWQVDLSSFTRILEVEEACNALEAFQAAHPDRWQ